jgi:translation initiation factor 3 subunit H
MNNDGRLEVTNCFPFPPRDMSEDEESVATYTADMMRRLRDVNIDHNHVGWYQSALLGSFVTPDVISSQYRYQSQAEDSVLVVYGARGRARRGRRLRLPPRTRSARVQAASLHCARGGADPFRTTRGSLSLRALRLTEAFMDVYRAEAFTPDVFKRTKLTFDSVFEELPVVVRNGHLVNALLYELEDGGLAARDELYDRMDLSGVSFLERSLELMIMCIDDLASEQAKYSFYQRQLARHQAHVQAYLQKRRAENDARRAAGEEPLPDEDVDQVIKPPQTPSRLGTLLITAQVNQYCRQVSQFSGEGLGKLCVAEKLRQ